MPIDTHNALVGRLLEDPVLESRTGHSRFIVHALVEPRRQAPGSPVASGAATQTLTAIGVTAERAFEQFAEGDYVIAAGAVRLALCGRGPGCTAGLVFEAWYLGHDLTRTRYVVDRTRRHGNREPIRAARRRDEIERELEIAAPVPARSARS